MKRKLKIFARRYQAALSAHLKSGPHASLKAAKGLGSQALGAGLQTLELAKIHERTLLTLLQPGLTKALRNARIKQAGAFFAAAIVPTGMDMDKAGAVPHQLNKFIEMLSQRTIELAASNLELSLEVAQRQVVESALKKSEQHYALLLAQSDQLQEQLRRLSRQVLSAQEEERKKISRELHDVIAQTLTGINIRLAALKTEATANNKGLQERISSTQKLVERSVDIVHRFARELRPAVLDDLGLIPALHTFVKNFQEETGVRVSLAATGQVEQLNSTQRTILFRVAQEALTNVARHAKASQVQVTIKQEKSTVSLQVTDNGKGFPAERVMQSKKQKRLGLLGMRERVEMVKGTFTIESKALEGTTIRAHIPLADGRPPRTKP
jgi:signal transduction histidine kinase